MVSPGPNTNRKECRISLKKKKKKPQRYFPVKAVFFCTYNRTTSVWISQMLQPV